MKAISDIAQLNKVREGYIIIENRLADPSIGVFKEAMTSSIIKVNMRGK